jgi:predicted enzyme related to lactoylglutathione lyase
MKAVGGLMADVEFTAQLVVEVYVRDIERSLHFYGALGFDWSGTRAALPS